MADPISHCSESLPDRYTICHFIQIASNKGVLSAPARRLTMPILRPHGIIWIPSTRFASY